MDLLDKLIQKMDSGDPCNRYFRNLPRGKTLSALWASDNIYLNYSPSWTAGDYGATHPNHKDITLTAWLLSTQSKYMIAATLVHELAHIGGAPGGASTDAEDAVGACYFRAPVYRPWITGSIQDIADQLEMMG
jgi:hypothetical protein